MQLSERQIELADENTVASCVAELRDLLDGDSLAERKAFIRSFVKEVKVTGEDVLITYTIPMLPRGITEENLPVLCIEHYGGPSWTKGKTPTVSVGGSSGKRE